MSELLLDRGVAIAGEEASIDGRRPPGIEGLRHLVGLTGYDSVDCKQTGLRLARAAVGSAWTVAGLADQPNGGSSRDRPRTGWGGHSAGLDEKCESGL
jgi:hypothetical protein